MTVIHVELDHIREYHLGSTVLFEHNGKTLISVIVRLWTSERELHLMMILLNWKVVAAK